MNLSTKQKQTQRTDLCLPSGRVSKGGTEWEAGVSRCKLWCRRRRNLILLCSAGDYTQYPGITHRGKEQGKKCAYMND